MSFPYVNPLVHNLHRLAAGLIPPLLVNRSGLKNPFSFWPQPVPHKAIIEIDDPDAPDNYYYAG